jgi:hypothetical protein
MLRSAFDPIADISARSKIVVIEGGTMLKVLLALAVIAAVSVCAWFLALRYGALVWVLQSISMVAVIAAIGLVARAVKRPAVNQQR